MLDNEFRLRRIQVKKLYAVRLQTGLVDENQLEQVFVNLLLNAAHAVEKDGTIRIRTTMDSAGKHALIEVHDTGCGIPPEHMNNLFEPFFSTKQNGSGLGLAVSYGIVKNHGGQLTVTSTPGKGSCFTVMLPNEKGTGPNRP